MADIFGPKPGEWPDVFSEQKSVVDIDCDGGRVDVHVNGERLPLPLLQYVGLTLHAITQQPVVTLSFLAPKLRIKAAGAVLAAAVRDKEGKPLAAEEVEQLRAEWTAAFGDLDDAETQKRVEATVRVLQAVEQQTKD